MYNQTDAICYIGSSGFRFELRNRLNTLYYTIEHDPMNNWNSATWIGYASMEEAMAAWRCSLKFIREWPNPRMLNDYSRNASPLNDICEWVNNIWIPEATQIGVRKLAQVVPAKNLTEVTQCKRSGVNNFDFEMQIFNSSRDANVWLHGSKRMNTIL